MPGNHDLGLHLDSQALMSWERERFQEAFGPTQGQREWNGWDIVWVDSMALLEEGVAGTEARGWIDKVGKRERDSLKQPTRQTENFLARRSTD